MKPSFFLFLLAAVTAGEGGLDGGVERISSHSLSSFAGVLCSALNPSSALALIIFLPWCPKLEGELRRQPGLTCSPHLGARLSAQLVFTRLQAWEGTHAHYSMLMRSSDRQRQTDVCVCVCVLFKLSECLPCRVQASFSGSHQYMPRPVCVFEGNTAPPTLPPTVYSDLRE